MIYRLSDEQQLSIFWQWPQSIVNNQFELIDLIADLVELRLYIIVISDSLLVLVLNLVGKLASVNQFLNTLLDG